MGNHENSDSDKGEEGTQASKVYDVIALPGLSLGQLQEKQLADPLWGPIILYLRDKKQPEDPAQARHVARTADMYSLQVDGLLYRDAELGRGMVPIRECRMCVPVSLIQQISRRAVLRPYGSKEGYGPLIVKYYYPNIVKHVSKVIRSCVTCPL